MGQDRRSRDAAALGGEAEDAGLRCEFCAAPIEAWYFDVAGQVACNACGVRAGSPTGGLLRFVGAAGLGLAVALAGGAAVFALTRVVGDDVELVTVLIAVLIGLTVRRASGRRGGWRYQTLAVGLTYVAIGAWYGVQHVYHDQVVLGPKPFSWAGLQDALWAMVEFPITMNLGSFGGIFSLLIFTLAMFEAWRFSRGQGMAVVGPLPKN